MPDLDVCPHCGASMQGEPIPQDLLDRGGYGTATHWQRRIGVEVQGAYDGILYWQCPDCGGTWHRWPEGAYQHARAVQYVNRGASTTPYDVNEDARPSHDR